MMGLKQESSGSETGNRYSQHDRSIEDIIRLLRRRGDEDSKKFPVCRGVIEKESKIVGGKVILISSNLRL